MSGIDKRPFEVDEMLKLASPFTQTEIDVSYRGGDLWEAVVYDPVTGWQGTVSQSWLRRPTDKVADFEDSI